jgi:hypothetical protein
MIRKNCKPGQKYRQGLIKDNEKTYGWQLDGNCTSLAKRVKIIHFTGNVAVESEIIPKEGLTNFFMVS